MSQSSDHVGDVNAPREAPPTEAQSSHSGFKRVTGRRLHQITDPLEPMQIPPESRSRTRADGGCDELYRVNFAGAITRAEIHRLLELLLDTVREGGDVGIVALTKVEVLEPDVLEYRFWCRKPDAGRQRLMRSLWQRLHAVHAIRNVDGIPYPSLVDSSPACTAP